MKKKALSRLVVFLLMVVMTGLLPITAFAGNGNSDNVLTQATPGCSYQTHVQNDGWQGFKSNGDMSGTSGRSLRLEGIEIKLDNQGYDLGVSYQTHIQNTGWEANTNRGWKSNGTMSGTEGLSYRLEAIQIKLIGTDADKFDIYYQVHAENFGWLGWAKNGESSGTAGYGYRLEGIRIQIVEKGTDAPGTTENAFIDANSVGNIYKAVLGSIALKSDETARYTVWDLNDDNVSELLVSISGIKTNGVGYVNVYTRNGSEVIKVDCSDKLFTGVASAGGLRANLKYSNKGILRMEAHSYNPEVYFKTYILEGSTLVETPFGIEHEEGTKEYEDARADVLATFTTIDWHDILDMSGLDSLKLLAEEQVGFTNSFEDFYGASKEECLNLGYNYTLNNSDYQDRLIENFKGDDRLVTRKQKSEWGGSCFGISATMILASLGELNTQNFDSDAVTYSDLKKPCNSEDVRDLMNYYQIAQYSPEVDECKIITSKDGSEDGSIPLEDFLKNLVERSKRVDSDGAILFGIMWPDNIFAETGHAMVINGCTGGDYGSDFELELVDSNSIAYIKLVISSDYSTFYFVRETGEKAYVDNWVTMDYFDSLNTFDAVDIEG